VTSAAEILDPQSNAAMYVTTVLNFYVELPDTPERTNARDQRQARDWFDRSVPLAVVEAALMLGSLRRRLRPADAPRLSGVRSLAYFQPIVEELIENPPPSSYFPYLRAKFRTVAAPTGSA